MTAASWTEKQREALAFPGNMCVLAGAGSGKTMTLVELIVRLMAGEIKGYENGVELTSILALTYTEKAAREMRERVRESLNERIRSSGGETRRNWLRQRRFLDRAQISTIHSFCLQVLRQFGMDVGIDPDFAILDEDRDFISNTTRDILLNWLVEKDPDLIALMDYFPWLSRGRGSGVDRLLNMIIEHGRTYGRKIGIYPQAPLPVTQLHDDLISAAGMVQDLIEAGDISPDKTYFETLRCFVEGVNRLVAGRAENEIFENIDELDGLVKGSWFKAKPAREKAAAAIASLRAERDRQLSLPIKENLLRLADKMDQAILKAKQRKNALDFDDLLLQTKTLLAENLEARHVLKNRYRVVLVDEFQDTNRLQADILAYLLEPNDAAGAILPELESPIDVLPRAPQRLVVFGDPKQSIYRFRGAEVGVFNRLKDSIIREGDNSGNPSPAGALIPLNKNFRSQSRLIDFYNRFFPTIMNGREDWDAAYTQDDIQAAHRKNLAEGPAAWILITPEADNTAREREQEADRIAAYLTRMISGAMTVRVADDGRPAEYRDVAVLLRRFTHLSAYEQSFRKAGIPFYTVRGQGFYQCSEVRDLINLLFYLAGTRRDQALLGLLRSPLFGISDETVTRLAWPDSATGHMDLNDYFRENPPRWPDGLTTEQLSALDSAQHLLGDLSKRAGRSFPVELLEKAVEDTQFLAVLLALEQGDQKVANVQKLIEMTRSLSKNALCAHAEMARFLEARLADTQDDPEAQGGAEGENAVQIMTIHQAKGLQFPVVIVPDSAATPRYAFPQILFDESDRLSLTFRSPETMTKRLPADYTLQKETEKNKERAEHARLLYVAATRARDHLVFSGRLPEIKKQPTLKHTDSWLGWLLGFAEAYPSLLGVIQDSEDLSHEESERCAGHPDAGPLPDLNAPSEASFIVNRVHKKSHLNPSALTVNVTSLTQYLACPRRFFLEGVLGIPGNARDTMNREPSTGLIPRDKGNVFHKLMEIMDLSRPVNRDELIAKAQWLIRSAELHPEKTEVAEIADKVIEFTGAPWGQGLFAAWAAGGLVQREEPVWLRIRPESKSDPVLVLTGEIDLFYILPGGPARLIDYKYTHPGETKRYEPQVKMYVAALLQAGLKSRLEAGLYFVSRDSGQQREIEFEPGWLEKFLDELRSAGREMNSLMLPGRKLPPPPHTCLHLDCDLFYACKP